MPAIGKIDRLPFDTGNSMLLTLVEYDTSALLSQILNSPKVRSFFDFTDPTTMTFNGNLAVTVTSKKGGFVATGAAGERAVYSESIINGQGGLTFDGTKKYSVPGLFPTTPGQLSVSAGIFSTTPANTSQIYLADADNANVNFYTIGDQARSISGDVFINTPMRNLMKNVITTVDYVTQVASMFVDDLSVSNPSTRLAAAGDAMIGAWNTANAAEATTRYIGHMGYIATFTEDLADNAPMRAMMNEYCRRRFRT